MTQEQMADSVLVTTNPLLIVAALAAAALAAWLCARAYRNTNDFKKSVRIYVPSGVVLTAAFWLLGLPLLFSAGAALCGFVFLMGFSNHYFYH